MSHQILFDRAPSGWNEGLPFGNGTFGGMAWSRGEALNLAFNDYEVYYSCLRRYSRGYRERLEKGEAMFRGQRPTFPEYRAAARASLEDGARSGEFAPYQSVLWPTAGKPRRASRQNGESHPPTGEVDVVLGGALKDPEDYRLSLEIEDALLRFEAHSGEHGARLEGIAAAGKSAFLLRCTARREGDIAGLALRYPQRRGHEGFAAGLRQTDPRTFVCTVAIDPPPEDRGKYEPFRFAAALCLAGAAGEAGPAAALPDGAGWELPVRLEGARGTFFAAYAVCTELSGGDPAEKAVELARRTLERRREERAEHDRFWRDYFSRCRVSLPDKFLEKLWYLNLYVLGCSSGLGGKRAAEACGLNGLWDVRQPTLWGSMWYWDVNIEAAFWPVFAANHLELARHFCEGYAAHAAMARKRAAEYYGMAGAAIDYPHPFYNCIGPWCAQFLWWYYEYTLDEAFLRDEAYPLMRDLALFVRDFAARGEDGRIHFFPDVSPEQGPITRDSVITVSCARFLLDAAAKAADILVRPPEEAALYRDLLQSLPDYDTDFLTDYGETLRDSHFAPAGLRLRHPSVLMPIFPAGNLDLSDERARRIAGNTLDFAAENAELGVFGFGWLACAAARLGRGDTALRLLYEKGIDLIVRANGMGAEETDRWLNFCLANKAPCYYPAMMECVGETVAAVNEMLLHSHGGVIAPFPAVPAGRDDAPRRGPRMAEARGRYPAWDDCGFRGMLARGGFRVSARRRGGRAEFIRLECPVGGEARVSLPAGLEDARRFILQPGGSFAEGGLTAAGDAVSFAARPGEVSVLCRDAAAARLAEDWEQAPEGGEADGVLVRTSHLSRRVFAGKDRNTDAMKLLDGALCDCYVANDRRRCMTVYRFTFGPAQERGELRARDIYAPWEDEMEPSFIRVSPADVYTARLGFGFAGEPVAAADRRRAGALRRDFVCGAGPARFLVELPRGRYDFLVLSGDEEEDSFLALRGPDGAAACERALRAGEYHARLLPFCLERDGTAAIELDTRPGSRWKLTALVVRKHGAWM